MRRLVQASLLALLAGLVLMGAATDDASPAPVEDRGGIPPTVTAEEALAAVVEWAGWLGIRAEECSVRSDDWNLDAFSHYYTVTSRDGRHEFRVNGYSGNVASWRDTQGPARGSVPEDATEREALASIARQFVSEHLPFLEPAVMVEPANPFLWVRALDGEVLFYPGSFARVRASLETGAVYEVSVHRGEPRAGTSPRLSPQDCREAAVAFVQSFPGLELIDAEPELSLGSRWLPRYYLLSQDLAAAQRLNRWFFMRISKKGERERPYRVTDGGGLVLLSVDARTGEVFRAEGMEQDPGRIPVYLNGREFLSPLFPPRVRGGVAYLAVDYLDSRIWRGHLETPAPGQITVEYDGSAWEFTAGERRYTVDGAAADLASAPILEAEVFYLPLEAVTLITGWSAGYSPADEAVYLNAPDPDEDG